MIDSQEIVNRVFINFHSSICVTLESGRAAYFDPLGFDREEDERPEAAVVFVSHIHADHFSPKNYQRIAAADTVFVMPESIVEEACEQNPGLRDARVVACKPGDAFELQVNDGPQGAPLAVKVEAVPAYNMNKDFHPRANGWVGFIAEIEGVRYYVAGDSDATPELVDAVGRCDAAFLPCGGTYTMTALEAAAAVDAAAEKPALAVPTHFGEIAGTTQDGMAFAQALESEIDVLVFELE